MSSGGTSSSTATGGGPGSGPGGRPPGLRELKKQRTERAISDAALRLFTERGYDEVSVAEVALAAEVSKPTLFKYFASKEELLLSRFADHLDEPARTVRSRPAGTDPVDALHDHFRDGLDRHDPITGLNDLPQVLALSRILYRTPALRAGMWRFIDGSQQLLADTLREAAGAAPGDLRPETVAVQLLGVQRVLANANVQHMLDGESAWERHPAAVAEADRAFGLLRNGLAGYGR